MAHVIWHKMWLANMKMNEAADIYARAQGEER